MVGDRIYDAPARAELAFATNPSDPSQAPSPHHPNMDGISTENPWTFYTESLTIARTFHVFGYPTFLGHLSFMFRFIPMLAGISLILFSTACVANADSAETDISGTLELRIF